MRRRTGLALAMLACAGLACAPRGARRPDPNRNALAETGDAGSGSLDARVLEDLGIVASPPPGWVGEALETSGLNRHVVWTSPSGATAYGVIRFRLPIPVTPDLAVWGYLQNMKSAEGTATVIERSGDDETHGVRFTAEGGRYRVRNRLFVRGMTGWVVYAGTRLDLPIDGFELERARIARDDTVRDFLTGVRPTGGALQPSERE